jgi:hypothetical protein
MLSSDLSIIILYFLCGPVIWGEVDYSSVRFRSVLALTGSA